MILMLNHVCLIIPTDIFMKAEICLIHYSYSCLILQLENHCFLINVAFWKQSFLTSFFYLYTFYVPKKWLLQYLSQGGILDSSPIKKNVTLLFVW